MDHRVSVCLTRYYNDERSYCYIYLDKKYETIASLAKHIKNKFRIKNEFCLMTNNNLLPDYETIKIIHIGDKITVVPIQKKWWDDQEPESTELESNTNEAIDVVDSVVFEKSGKKKKKKKSKSETTEQAHYNDEETIPLKKDKPHCDESTHNELPKKKGSLMDVSMTSPSEQENEVRENGNEDTTDENSQDTDLRNESQNTNEMQSAIQQLKIKALTLLTEVASQKQVAGVSGGRINKRKRIRKRNKNSSLSMSTPDLSDSATSAPITFKPVIKSASHIRFDNTEQQMNASKTVRNAEITPKPRIIHAVETNSSTNSRRTSISGSGDPEQIFSNNVTVATPENQKPKFSIDSVKKRLNEFPIMDNVYPVEKDLVLFKMLKMGNDYTPSISDYILGNVVEVDKAIGIVKMSILDGHEECRPVVGKFDLDSPTEEDKPLDDSIVDIVWSRVNEARLIFP